MIFAKTSALFGTKSATIQIPKSSASSYSKELFKALYQGDTSKLQAVLLNKRENLEMLLENGEFPLHVSVRMGHIEMTKFLVEQGADLSKKDADGLTPIEYAALKGDLELISALMPPSFLQKMRELNESGLKFQCADALKVERLKKEIELYKKDFYAAKIKPIHESDFANKEQVSVDDLAACLMQKNFKAFEKLLVLFEGDINKSLENFEFHLTHLAAMCQEPKALTLLIERGAEIFPKSKGSPSFLDLLFLSASSKDPLRLKKEQLIFVALSAFSILFDHVVKPKLSTKNETLFKTLILFLNVSLDLKLSYQNYLKLDPQSFLKKILYWACSASSASMYLWIEHIPAAKIAWDVWQCYGLFRGTVKGLCMASTNYKYEPLKSFKYAAVETMNFGAALYHTHKSFYKAAKMAQSFFQLFNSWPQFCYFDHSFEQKVSQMPISYHQRSLACSLQDTLKCSELIFKRNIQNLLQSGNYSIKLNDGFSGAYTIKDARGNIQALFKPEDERNWGPCNRKLSHRKKNPTPLDVYFHKLSSFEQGMKSKRQYLANQLDFPEVSRLPIGTLIELESDLFVDSCNALKPFSTKAQSKWGYLQEWVHDSKSMVEFHPLSKSGKSIPKEAYFDMKNNPILQNVPLDEFQKIGILDVLLYNEDRHEGNILVRKDQSEELHLTPIDCDNILPYELNNLVSVIDHARAAEPFTEKSLRYIESLNPNKNFELIQEFGLGNQAAINGYVLALVLKKFAGAKKTLKNIFEFVSVSRKEIDAYKKSELWQLMEEVKKEAIDSLSEKDKLAYLHFQHLLWLHWQGKEFPKTSGKEWFQDYKSNKQQRIENLILKNFLETCAERIDKYLKKTSPYNKNLSDL